jgi:hypothetical protein
MNNPAWVKAGAMPRGNVTIYILRERQRTDPVASQARKTLASPAFTSSECVKHAPETYLAMVGQAAGRW